MVNSIAPAGTFYPGYNSVPRSLVPPLSVSNTMPAIAQIVLNDGTVNHNFDPLGIDANYVASYENRTSGIQIGYESLSVGFRRANTKSRNNKVTVRLSLPTLEVTSPSTMTGIQPQPTKAYDVFASVDFVFPERCTTAERSNIRQMLIDALGEAAVASVIENLESIY